MSGRGILPASGTTPTTLTAGREQTHFCHFLNGRVMDSETLYDATANVGVKDGRIAVITKEPISGSETIDAAGHVVTAGFIDQHFHFPRPFGYKLALRDGVTSAMDLEAGANGYRIDEWYKMNEGRSQVNYGTGSSHEFAAIGLEAGKRPWQA